MLRARAPPPPPPPPPPGGRVSYDMALIKQLLKFVASG